MLLVKTKVKTSKIHGLGLFADEFIPKGSVIWKFTPGFDLKFTKVELAKLPKLARQHVKFYGWLSKKSGMYCHSSDNGKYFNHSNKPNALSAYYQEEDEVLTKALKDIKKGEEITDNYKSFTNAFKKKE